MNEEINITVHELREIAQVYIGRKRLTSDGVKNINGFINFISLVKLAEETEIKEGN